MHIIDWVKNSAWEKLTVGCQESEITTGFYARHCLCFKKKETKERERTNIFNDYDYDLVSDYERSLRQLWGDCERSYE